MIMKKSVVAEKIAFTSSIQCDTTFSVQEFGSVYFMGVSSLKIMYFGG